MSKWGATPNGKRMMPADAHKWYHLPPPILQLPQSFYQPFHKQMIRQQPAVYHRDIDRKQASAQRRDRYEPPTSPYTHQPHDRYAPSQHPLPVRFQHDTLTSETESRIVETDAKHEEDLTFEFSEGFKEFLAVSAAHRKQRDAKKPLAKEKKPRAQTGAKEKKKPRPSLKENLHLGPQMYGERHAWIKQLETSVNMLHDSTVDVAQPELWPSLPLNL
eukprot:m.58231 g.58231  ORF g.58231 m.58231 type:complete len:217 (-) comp22520_c1_seq1:1209-1859(-)